MELLLILIYASICIVIFKIFRIPLNKWSVPTAVLGGIVILGALVMSMNYNHPYSHQTRKYTLTTPIIPTVTGRVISVAAQGNTPLQPGDELFRLDPTPFQARLDSLAAQLISAREDLVRAERLAETGTGTQRDRDLAQAQVDELTAEIHLAQYNLDETVVRAPTAGYVTQVTLRPGMRAVSLPLRPVMVFVNDEEDLFVSWFRQNSLLRLEVGDEAEIAFDGIPGRVFAGEVVELFPVLPEAELQPGGTLFRDTAGAGTVPVRIRITDPAFEEYRDKVPGGAYAQAALYSEHFHHVAVLRKILLRMSSWMNFLFPIH